MNERKKLFQQIFNGIVPGVIVLVLIIAICAVGLMILNSRNGPMLSYTPTDTPTDKPTDAPTDGPTEPPTEKPTYGPTEPPTEPPTEAPADSFQELKDKTALYLKQNMINGEKYTLVTFTLEKDPDRYRAYYSYLIHGVPTMDRCYVYIDPDGTNVWGHQFDEGLCDDLPITEEMIRQADEDMFLIYDFDRAITTVDKKTICYAEELGIYIHYEIYTYGYDFTISCTVPLVEPPKEPTEDLRDQIPIPEGPVTVDTAIYYMGYYVADTSRYTLFEFSYSPEGLYTAIFYHQICGVDTMDHCTVIMREDGSLYNCVVDNEKAFDNVAITEEMIQIAQDNLYGIYTLSKEEWTSKPTMIHWVDKKLMITFLVTAKDGSMSKSCDVQLNWNLTLPDDKMAVECALRYLNLKGYGFEGYSSVLDNSPGAAHYDVMVQVNGIRYECEVYVSDGTIRNVRSEIVK